MPRYETYEIVQLYKEAADKNKQIAILAELNCCSKEEIFNILAEEGCISGVSKKIQNKKDKRQSERGKWTEERLKELQGFIDEGLKASEIAERMGENKQCIYDAVNRYIKGNKERRNIPQVKYNVSDAQKGPVKKSLPPNKEDEKQTNRDTVPHIKHIMAIHNMEDMRAVAIVAKDICNVINMVSEQEMEDYESTVQTLVSTIGQLLDDIITKGSENIE